jgi:hypothetical protein
MKALNAMILYVAFLLVGGGAAVLVSSYIETLSSSWFSNIVFLFLFFANFVTSWIATIFAMEGSLNNMSGAKEQLEAERVGRASLLLRTTAASKSLLRS